ncbi:hypothetical protein SO802_006813 [Lithocarpus litseifolius]|uniref:Uncharacterized protein n=1 Tax=Lithocarpus litseifolius TaxID=425828 RepID=A0AAW2DQY2_9ROSI
MDQLSLPFRTFYSSEVVNPMQAIIASCCGCFHGRTLAVISMSCDNDATRGFRPLLPGLNKVDFSDTVALEKIFKDTWKSVGWWSDTCKCSACRQRCNALYPTLRSWKKEKGKEKAVVSCRKLSQGSQKANA